MGTLPGRFRPLAGFCFSHHTLTGYVSEQLSQKLRGTLLITDTTLRLAYSFPSSWSCTDRVRIISRDSISPLCRQISMPCFNRMNDGN
jgi:hypothetical protein